MTFEEYLKQKGKLDPIEDICKGTGWCNHCDRKVHVYLRNERYRCYVCGTELFREFEFPWRISKDLECLVCACKEFYTVDTRFKYAITGEGRVDSGNSNREYHLLMCVKCGFSYRLKDNVLTGYKSIL